ncbi:MAG: nucleotidyl transferase AbiEii/AbiGii toxin family protein [Candidatus Cloacimonetes bacterium]|nr:nucleotidyl transferase AbiEii/AbiGii toxin family protein [Candidatus Cloacimonadota bacterium]
MIHREAISDQLWNLILKMMSYDPLKDFYLAGGTALALKLGHRESIDIDLFAGVDFNPAGIAMKLVREFSLERVHHEPETVRAIISGTKVDLIRHDYQSVGPVETIEGIRIASLPDLAAMKLNAISGRGLKKDFWDIAALLRSYSLDQMISFFMQKYKVVDNWHLIKALEYFGDAERDDSEIRGFGNMDWNEVKRAVVLAAETYLQT